MTVLIKFVVVDGRLVSVLNKLFIRYATKYYKKTESMFYGRTTRRRGDDIFAA